MDPTKNTGDGGGCDGGEGSDGGGGGSGAGGSGSTNNPSCPDASGAPMAGDPINAATGNKYLQDDDYFGNVWLTFRRFYNSHTAVAPASMGAHWRHSFDRSLEVMGSPASVIVMFRPDGKQETFTKTNGQWVADPDIADALIEADDAQGNAIEYTVFIAALHHFETYGTSGQLQSVTDETGVGITLAYSTTMTDPSIAPKPGLLLTVTGPKGRQLSFSYDASARVHQVVLPSGCALVYGYDANNNLVSVQYPDTKTRQYVYNESSLTGGANLPNAMTGIIDEAGVRYENTDYDSTGRALSSSFAGNVGTTIVTYNSDGTSTVRYPLGLSSTMGFSTVNGLVRVASLTQPCGPQCDQPWQVRTYDINGYPKSRTDFNGNVTATTYDASGLLTQEVDAQGKESQRTINTTWDTTLRLPRQRTVADASDTAVSKIAWVYNDRGQPLAVCQIDPAQAASYTCDPAGVPPTGVRRWTYTYCDAIDSTQCPLVGLLLSSDGPRIEVADITHHSYFLDTDESGCGTVGGACHRAGDLYQITNAEGRAETYLAYDKNGRVARHQNVSGLITDYTYSPRGWLVQKVERANSDGTPSADDAATTLVYSDVGDLHTLTDPDGVGITYDYDVAHRLTDITDAMGRHIHYTLDAAGNKIKEETFDNTGAVVRSLTRTYNTLGQLTSVMDGLNRTVLSATFADSYDADGNLVHTADGAGIERKLGHDALNRLVSTIKNYNGTDTATSNTQTVTAYDALDRVDGVSDPEGLNTTYDYDGLNDLGMLQSPDTGTTTYGYDEAGNHASETDARGITSTHVYDVLNRLRETHFPTSSQDIAYSYSDDDTVTGCNTSHYTSRLTRILENGGVTVFCYDVRGNVIQKRQVLSGASDVINYAYTKANRLLSVQHPDGTLVEYQHDLNGRISLVTVTAPDGTKVNAASSIAYLPFGPITSYTLGNGQTINRTYDANYALSDLSSPALALHFARDVMGNITALGDAPGANPAKETYSYDPLYRLTAVEGPNGTTLEAYTYNKTGDRLSKTGGGFATGAYSYETWTHHLSATGTATRTYDANGNTIGSVLGGETFGYTYNDRNRLSLVQRNGVTAGTYVYNAMGERIQKALTNDTVRYYYNAAGQLTAETSETGTSRAYVWVDSLPVAVIDTTNNNGIPASTVNYVHADGLGTPRVVTNSAGSVVWQWSYQTNPFGEQQPSAIGGYALNLRYPGQYYDAESGAAGNGFRDYDISSGRYLQSDPLGMAGGVSSYAYAEGNPLALIDPLGLYGVQDVLFPPSTILSEEPPVIRPLIEPVKPLPPGTPVPQLPDDFPQLPSNPAQCPGDGWEWRGPDAPGGPRGGWYNPRKDWTLHPDLDHPEPIGPHWDWIDENGTKYRISPASPSVDPLQPRVI